MVLRQNIEELDEGELELHAEEDRSNIERALSAATAPAATPTIIQLAMLQLPHDRAAPSDQYPMQQSFDCSQLIRLRQTHETERAKKSGRTRTTRTLTSSGGDSDSQLPEKPVKTPRREIIQQMSAILREEQDGVGSTSGLNRIARIQMPVAKPAGNSANAELAAGQRAATVRELHLIGIAPNIS